MQPQVNVTDAAPAPVTVPGNGPVRTAPGGPVRRQRSRSGDRVSRFVFTLNNWTEEEYGHLERFASGTKWFVMGKEVGENGTPHLQGNCVAERFLVCNCELCLQ